MSLDDRPETADAALFAPDSGDVVPVLLGSLKQSTEIVSTFWRVPVGVVDRSSALSRSMAVCMARRTCADVDEPATELGVCRDFDVGRKAG
jgi:hypothetical protein